MDPISSFSDAATFSAMHEELLQQVQSQITQAQAILDAQNNPTTTQIQQGITPDINMNFATPAINLSAYTATTRLEELNRAEECVVGLMRIIPKIFEAVKGMYTDSSNDIIPLVNEYVRLSTQIRAILHIHSTDPKTATTVPTNITAQGEIQQAEMSSLLVHSALEGVSVMLKKVEAYQQE